MSISPQLLKASSFVVLAFATSFYCVPTFAQEIDGSDSSDSALAEQVTEHYVQLAHLRYQDSLDAADELLGVLNAFISDPNEETHAAAKQAWSDAHQVYSHTEIYRFGNPNVDAWEGKVNAWPMDEGLIDYVSSDYVYHEGNPHALENIIGNGRVPITDEVIAEYQSGLDPKAAPDTTITDLESNVTTGFHAIEFLLWGQDLNRSPQDCGKRPYTDFLSGERGTNGNCVRRCRYLSAAARLLIADLRIMIRDWNPEGSLYSKVFFELTLEERLDRMLVGMGSLCFAELATERMRVAMITNDQEEEQSCFSDLTHLAIWNNAKSVETTYLGQHRMRSGELVEGPSLSDLVRKVDPDLDQELRSSFAQTTKLIDEFVTVAEAGEPFDQMILPENQAGRERIAALMEQLGAQTELLEKVRSLKGQLAELE